MKETTKKSKTPKRCANDANKREEKRNTVHSRCSSCPKKKKNKSMPLPKTPFSLSKKIITKRVLMQ